MHASRIRDALRCVPVVPLFTSALAVLLALCPLPGGSVPDPHPGPGPGSGGMGTPPAAVLARVGPAAAPPSARGRGIAATLGKPGGARGDGPSAPGAYDGGDLDPAWEEHRARTGPDVELGGFLRVTAGRFESVGGVNSNSVDTGISLSNARLSVDGRLERFRVYVSLEGSSEQGRGYIVKQGEGEQLQVLDAFGELGLTPWASLQVGQFRPPILFGALTNENDLLFIDRTFNDLWWQAREPGAQVRLDGGRLQGWLALQNGADDTGEELAFTARASVRVFGEGEAPRREGAYDPDLGQTLYLGAAWYDDGSLSQGTALATEAYYTWERLSLSGELVQYGDGILGGNLFWSATGALALVPDTWELALRYEDFSSRSDTFVWRLGLNRYLRGPGTKVQANLVRLEHDGADNYQTLLELGLVTSL